MICLACGYEYDEAFSQCPRCVVLIHDRFRSVELYHRRNHMMNFFRFLFSNPIVCIALAIIGILTIYDPVKGSCVIIGGFGGGFLIALIMDKFDK